MTRRWLVPPELWIITPPPARPCSRHPFPTACHPSRSPEMAIRRKRKQRQRHTDHVVDVLNGINGDSPRVTRRRRQTAPDRDIFEIPDSPERPAEDRAPSGLASSANGPRNQGNDRPAQQADEFDSEGGSVSDEDEHAPASSEHDNNGNDDPERRENTAEEELGVSSQGQLSRLSDANEAPSASRERSRSGAQRERSSSGPGPGNQLAVVIHSHRSEHQATGDERDGQGDNAPNPDDPFPSVPETPPARPSRSRPSARRPARKTDPDFDIQPDEQSAQDGSGYETGHEYQEAPVSPVEPSGQTKNESRDGSRNSLHNWFLQTIDDTPFANSWRTFHAAGGGLRRYQIKPMPECLRESRRLISKMRELYKEIIRSEGFSHSQAKQLRNFRESIYADLKQISEYASEELGEATVLDQYEAHLIPKMVTLVLLSFKTFIIVGRSAADQLYETLDLVLRCSVRILDYSKTGLLKTHARSRTLRLQLKRLKGALESGILDDHLPEQARPTQTERQPLQSLAQTDIPASKVSWTEKEDHALIEGLRQYRGERSLHVRLFPHSWFDSSVNAGDDRFILIVRYLGDRLPRRTVRDLKARTQEFRRNALRNGKLDEYDWLRA